MNKKLIKQLRKGTVALVNDGTLEELNKVLKYAFPNGASVSKGLTKYYFASEDKNYWFLNNTTDLSTHSVKEFLSQEKQIMKVTDLKENECIHCETEEQAKAICKLMHEAGLTWHDGDSYLSVNLYDIYKSEICYFPAEGVFTGLDYAKEENNLIYKAEKFLTKK